MPKIYQAWYESDAIYRKSMTSLIKIESEARSIASESGFEVHIDVLVIPKPSLKLIVEMMNGRKPESRDRLCSFKPVGPCVWGEDSKGWKVKRVTS